MPSIDGIFARAFRPGAGRHIASRPSAAISIRAKAIPKTSDRRCNAIRSFPRQMRPRRQVTWYERSQRMRRAAHVAQHHDRSRGQPRSAKISCPKSSRPRSLRPTRTPGTPRTKTQKRISQISSTFFAPNRIPRAPGMSASMDEFGAFRCAVTRSRRGESRLAILVRMSAIDSGPAPECSRRRGRYQRSSAGFWRSGDDSGYAAPMSPPSDSSSKTRKQFRQGGVIEANASSCRWPPRSMT